MLQQPDLATERRLRHMQTFRGAAKVQFVADSYKAAQLADFEHDSILESIESVIGLIMHQCARTIDGIGNADDGDLRQLSSARRDGA